MHKSINVNIGQKYQDNLPHPLHRKEFSLIENELLLADGPLHGTEGENNKDKKYFYKMSDGRLFSISSLCNFSPHSYVFSSIYQQNTTIHAEEHDH